MKKVDRTLFRTAFMTLPLCFTLTSFSDEKKKVNNLFMVNQDSKERLIFHIVGSFIEVDPFAPSLPPDIMEASHIRFKPNPIDQNL